MEHVKPTLEILSLLIIGWISGAEIGSWFGIQPIVSRLPYGQQVYLEQAMLKTFGSVMPIVMPMSAVIVVLLAIASRNDTTIIMLLRLAASICIAVAIATTLIVNVPINHLTAQWELTQPADEWTRMRARWHVFQGLRGGLYLLSFILLIIASQCANHRAA